MKLQVTGNIVDTEMIYNIGPIEADTNGDIFFEFLINFLNGNDLAIKLDSQCHYDNGYMRILNNPNSPIIRGTLIDVQQADLYKKNKIRIVELREMLINYWKANQSVLPKIEF